MLDGVEITKSERIKALQVFYFLVLSLIFINFDCLELQAHLQ
jgi:hypothetical protein